MCVYACLSVVTRGIFLGAKNISYIPEKRHDARCSFSASVGTFMQCHLNSKPIDFVCSDFMLEVFAVLGELFGGDEIFLASSEDTTLLH